MTDRLLVTGFELHLPRCGNVYGIAPCNASIGVTGEYKCFNTPASCQVPVVYDEGEEKVLRFVNSSEYNKYEDLGVVAIPSLTTVRISPMMLRAAEDIGERETASLSFSNHRDNDSILDPYSDERDYNQYQTGDFWSKFDERYPNIQGYRCAVVRGYVGQNWDEMAKSEYIIDKGILSGDVKNYSITARDVFMLLQNNKSQIPMPCDGFLRDNMTTLLNTTFTLDPPGIGSLVFPNGKRMYPASGFAFIGEEYFQYTISGDVVTTVARALRNSTPALHEAGQAMQVVEVFESMTSAQILERVLGFSEIPSSWLNYSLWASEVVEYDPRLYSGEISEPTQVSQIVNELIKDVCLTVFPDVTTGKIIFEYMRNRPAAYSFSDDNMFNISRGKNYDKRISGVYIRFGRLNPLKKMDENTNYLGRIYRLNDNLNEVLQKNSDVTHNQHSRFIPINLREAANEITRIRLGRYSSPPRTMKFTLDKSEAPRLGKICSIDSRFLQDSRGFAGVKIPMQITSIAEDVGVYYLTAEEFKFSYDTDSTIHTINVIVDQFSINLRTLHDEIYSSVASGDTVRLVIDPNIKIGSLLSKSFALDTGSWPMGVELEIYLGSSETRIQGRGGYGGSPITIKGQDGGDALIVRAPLKIFGDGKIWSGGGGGGGFNQIIGGSPKIGDGGGGAGYYPGSGHNNGTINEGGEGIDEFDFSTGWGGNPGVDGTGSSASVPSFGYAGRSIVGVSFVTIIDSPSILGPQV